MYHSITFGDKNTWNDWHLVATSRPVFNPPSLKRKTLDIPGGDGLIDVSEALTGYPVYNNREGSFEFVVMNDYLEWQEAYSTISDYIHGQKMTAFLEDDPSYYYEGRFTVSNWKSDKNYSLITIDYDVAPYKRRFSESSKTIQISSTNKSYTFNSGFYGREPVCPTIDIQTENEGGAKLRLVNSMLGISTTKNVSDGIIQIPEFIFYGESVKMYFQATADGTATVRCTYGRL